MLTILHHQLNQLSQFQLKFFFPLIPLPMFFKNFIFAKSFSRRVSHFLLSVKFLLNCITPISSLSLGGREMTFIWTRLRRTVSREKWENCGTKTILDYKSICWKRRKVLKMYLFTNIHWHTEDSNAFTLCLSISLFFEN